MNKKNCNQQFVMVGSPDKEDTRPFVWKCLDEIGNRVEKLREDAAKLETEREVLLSMLQGIQDKTSHNMPEVEVEKEDIEAMAERLVCRCLTVEIGVITPRSEEQEAALNKVNKLLHEIEHQFTINIEKSLPRAISYLNACLTEPMEGHIDHRFQGMVIECTIDDQKKIKRRLQSLVEMYNNTEESNG
ncbi:BAG family molecular chaperone regulator 2-like [Saccostrea cucullata]|uniref:BAG family molecular chaperone regulator 2-like n=1 Tax=Saccostrea cuccullata TaxID=36930 RepID=UPI002ED46B9E